MIAESDPGGGERQEGGVQQFALAKFRWASPDRLDVEGRFVGSRGTPDGDCMLVLRGPDGEQRLLATDQKSGDDGSWRAVFVWDAPPKPFDTARLELGDDVAIALTDALPGDASEEPRLLDVQRGAAADTARPVSAVERLGLETDLAAAGQELSELRTAADRTAAQLERAEADLRAERDGRAAEAERFRESLASLRASAERAVADAQQESAARTAELAQAIEARDRELAELRAHVGRVAAVAPLATEARDAAQRLLDRLTESVGPPERDDGA
jgi:hypothetical protein